ncbi:hypothetical protein CONCODRAFT_4217 [Conidiobolus coronatus NRRL 28638]|uniref:Uncharacterized protein n=1 Tax=Conidiobolus coronatus (strain ATCC 28846 / CBS 209.66 / NRRL 28638) TaxID=796925 RepID=A0A137PD64_CONC2|nr:hypothetical protein CONCODRAFT_4217 [Conidiobolus coronatus NRRL 28638]|eukprot:KXN72937.1 hypothetical protein CONCODRAFT_4217 [Conidiobolus coronatus NRRL 28638]
MLLTKSNFSGILFSIICLTKLTIVNSSPLLGDMLGASGEEVASREGSVEEGGGGGDMTKADNNKKGDDGSGNLIINTGASSQGNYPPYYYYPPPPHHQPHYYPYPYPYPPPQQIGPFHDTQKFNFQYVKTG